nr:cysteine-rich receptor-like protein kinase 29 [Quercus suber]
MAMVSSILLFLSAICIFIAQAFAQPNFLYYFCLDNGNYTSKSTYNANLNNALSSLSSNTEIDYGFYNFSYGQNPDKVYSLGLCREDVQPDICRSCLNNATNLLPLLCPNQKEAIGWYDYCMLRYSFRDIFNIKETRPSFYMWNTNNVSANLDQFNQDLRTLLDSKRVQAAAGGSLLIVWLGLLKIFGNVVEASKEGDILHPAVILGKESNKSRTVMIIVLPIISFVVLIIISFCINLRVRKPREKPHGKESNKSRTVMIIVLPIISFVVLIIISFCINLRVRKPREKPHDEIRSVESLQLGFGTIKVATDDFSDANKLRQGGFGVVYKGKLFNGQVIAVKRLSKNSSQGDLEFKNEVLLVAKLQHRNLVRLLGFCLEGIERLLIYEFVPNGSLDNFIFDPIKRVQLDWARRYKIIGGIARVQIILQAWKNWKQGIVSNLVDPTLKAALTTEIMRCIHIGLLCVQENVVDRPTMASVVLMLNSVSITLPIPSKPAFFMNIGIELNICLQGEHDSRVTESDQSESSFVQASINEVSITELSPR